MNNDIEFLIDTMGDTVLINDVEHKALVTHSNETKNEEHYIHTLKQVKQGDLITYNNEKYLITTESLTNNAIKFKALMRRCNYSIEIAGETTSELLVDENRNPPIIDIYGDEQFIYFVGEPIYIYTIVENKTFAVSGTQLLVAENQILLIVQDNETNRNKLIVNNIFTVMDSEWKIRNVDKTQKGLLIIICEKTV
ncbi:hypothetical protein ACWV26_07220 [Rummeliibacillus sp. JY-2-4R]